MICGALRTVTRPKSHAWKPRCLGCWVRGSGSGALAQALVQWSYALPLEGEIQKPGGEGSTGEDGGIGEGLYAGVSAKRAWCQRHEEFSV
jgi:hypothetical protein